MLTIPYADKDTEKQEPFSQSLPVGLQLWKTVWHFLIKLNIL